MFDNNLVLKVSGCYYIFCNIYIHEFGKLLYQVFFFCVSHLFSTFTLIFVLKPPPNQQIAVLIGPYILMIFFFSFLVCLVDLHTNLRAKWFCIMSLIPLTYPSYCIIPKYVQKIVKIITLNFNDKVQ